MPGVSRLFGTTFDGRHRRLRDAFDRVQRHHQEQFLRFSLDAKKIVVVELEVDVSKQLLLGMVGTASPGYGKAVGGALPSGSSEAYDRTTWYSGRSG